MVHARALALMPGWLLYMGSAVLVPMVLGVMVTYLVLGVSSQIGRIPGLGRWIPPGWRHLGSALLIGYGLFQVLLLFAGSIASFAARAPEIQGQRVAVVQSAASALGLEGDLDWEVLRREVIGHVSLLALLQFGLSSTAALLGGLAIVPLNAIFILLAQGNFNAKLGMVSTEPAREAQLRAVMADIHARVGNCLAVTTLINLALGLTCYVILRVFGVEFDAHLAIASTPLTAVIMIILSELPGARSIVVLLWRQGDVGRGNGVLTEGRDI
jgi:predicted PurR-regulated permease PerM